MEFKTVGIIGKYGSQDISETLGNLIVILEKLGVTVLTDTRTAARYPEQNLVGKNTVELGVRCDLVIAIGGDGTFLHAARDMAPWSKPMLGVNLGRLGFLTDITPDQTMEHCIATIFQGKYINDTRHLLESVIKREGKEINRALSLNDVVIHKWEAARMIEFETKINGHFVSIQRSDGMIVSTPTGSTAYALSGGGPIVESGIDATLLVPICPHTLTNRPIVVSGKSKIEISLIGNEKTKAQLTCDGQTTTDLKVGDVAVITQYANPINLIHPDGYEPFTTWREKLHWSSAPH